MMGTRQNWWDTEQRIIYTNSTLIEDRVKDYTGLDTICIDKFQMSEVDPTLAPIAYVFDELGLKHAVNRGTYWSIVKEGDWLNVNSHWKGATITALKEIGHGYLWSRHWSEFVYSPLDKAFHFVDARRPPLFHQKLSVLVNGDYCYFDERNGLEDLIGPLKKSLEMARKLSNIIKQPVHFDVQSYEELCDALELEVKKQKLESVRWQEISDRLLDLTPCTECRLAKDEAYMGEDYELASAWKPKCDSCKFRFDTVYNATGYLD